jgi:hypothetical protein
MDESVKQQISDLISRDPEFKKSLEDLVCKPEYQKCIEDLVCDPRLRQGFEELNQMYSDEPVANKSKKKKKKFSDEHIFGTLNFVVGITTVLMVLCLCVGGDAGLGRVRPL